MAPPPVLATPARTRGAQAYDMVVQGMGGIMSLTGQPNSPPTRVGVSIGDLAAGLFLTIGVVGAIYKRSQGGGAVKVNVAMLDCQLALLEDAMAAYLRLGEVAQPQGARHPEIAPFQVFTANDGYFVIAAGNDRLFALLAKALERPDLLENPNYKTNALRRATSISSKPTWSKRCASGPSTSGSTS